jgi:HK97 family phage prohead protease
VPWRIEKREGRFCVIKETDGSTEKCHDTREQALAHQRALYAAEGPQTRAAVDNSEWDGNAAMSSAKTASDYRAICAGERTAGEPDERAHWALPHHKSPGSPPNAAGVRNALARLPQTQGLKNASAARAHLQRHMSEIGGESRSPTPTTEILERAAVVSDVDSRQYLIDVMAVPWDEPAQVFWCGELWTEVFHRGAFDGVEERAGRIRVNREHTKGATVGKIVGLDPHDEVGLRAQVKIVKSPAGEEIMALAEQDMTSVSIGYRANKPSDVRFDKVKKRRDVHGAFLDHLSFVEDPTWDRAQVLSVREGPNGLAVAEGPLPPTPALDAILQDDVIGWAASYPYRKEKA